MVSRGLGAQGNEVTEFPLGVIKIFFFFLIIYLFIYLKIFFYL